jgi:hypothetical protein
LGVKVARRRMGRPQVGQRGTELGGAGAGGSSGEFGSSSNSTSREGFAVGASDAVAEGSGGGVAASGSEFEEGAGWLGGGGSGSVVDGVGVTGSAVTGVRC